MKLSEKTKSAVAIGIVFIALAAILLIVLNGLSPWKEAWEQFLLHLH